MLTCDLYTFFDEVSVEVFCSFLIGLFGFLLLTFKSSLYILDNSSLRDVFFANLFSQVVACLLILLKNMPCKNSFLSTFYPMGDQCRVLLNIFRK